MRAQSPAGTSTGWPSGRPLRRPWTLASPRRAAPRPPATERCPPSHSATNDPGGAVSLANPASPRTTAGPEVWNAGPSTWARQAASSGSRSVVDRPGVPAATAPAASTIVCQPVQRHRWAAERAAYGPASRCPAAASRMTIPGVQNPHWLAPAATNASAQRVPDRGIDSLEGGDVPPGDPASRRDARDPGAPVDPDRAAAALPLGAAAVLDRDAAEVVAQHVEERAVLVGELDLGSVQAEPEDRGRLGVSPAGGGVQLKEDPQPQVREALGFEMWNPASVSPSL